MSDGAANDGQTAPAAKTKLTWGEKREKRRRNRRVFEEILGWVLVPALLYVGYLIFQAVGGIPKEAVDFMKELFATLTGGRL